MMGERRPAVFLDRDGVINRAAVTAGVPHPPDTVAEVEILPGVREACAKLAAEGLLLVGVTNQPDVARGTQTREAVDAINGFLMERLPLAAIYSCFHDNADKCDCRKPKPGLITKAAQEHGLDPATSYLVGDRWSDIAAGQAVGSTTFLIEETYSQGERCSPDFKVASLLAAAERILEIRHLRKAGS